MSLDEETKSEEYFILRREEFEYEEKMKGNERYELEDRE